MTMRQLDAAVHRALPRRGRAGGAVERRRLPARRPRHSALRKDRGRLLRHPRPAAAAAARLPALRRRRRMTRKGLRRRLADRAFALAAHPSLLAEAPRDRRRLCAARPCRRRRSRRSSQASREQRLCRRQRHASAQGGGVPRLREHDADRAPARGREHALARRRHASAATTPTPTASPPISTSARRNGGAASTALVIGAGGASRAVLQALIDARFQIRRGAEPHALARRGARAALRRARVRPAVSTGCRRRLPTADLIVNATSAGLHDGDGARRSLGGAPSRSAIATDLVYVPLVTPFLQGAREDGLKIVDGLGMLLHQAVPGFERWFGVRPTVDAELRAHVVADLKGERDARHRPHRLDRHGKEHDGRDVRARAAFRCTTPTRPCIGSIAARPSRRSRRRFPA